MVPAPLDLATARELDQLLPSPFLRTTPKAFTQPTRPLSEGRTPLQAEFGAWFREQGAAESDSSFYAPSAQNPNFPALLEAANIQGDAQRGTAVNAGHDDSDLSLAALPLASSVADAASTVAPVAGNKRTRSSSPAPSAPQQKKPRRQYRPRKSTANPNPYIAPPNETFHEAMKRKGVGMFNAVPVAPAWRKFQDQHRRAPEHRGPHPSGAQPTGYANHQHIMPRSAPRQQPSITQPPYHAPFPANPYSSSNQTQQQQQPWQGSNQSSNQPVNTRGGNFIGYQTPRVFDAHNGQLPVGQQTIQSFSNNTSQQHRSLHQNHNSSHREGYTRETQAEINLLSSLHRERRQNSNQPSQPQRLSGYTSATQQEIRYHSAARQQLQAPIRPTTPARQIMPEIPRTPQAPRGRGRSSAGPSRTIPADVARVLTYDGPAVGRPQVQVNGAGSPSIRQARFDFRAEQQILLDQTYVQHDPLHVPELPVPPVTLDVYIDPAVVAAAYQAEYDRLMAAPSGRLPPLPPLSEKELLADAAPRLDWSASDNLQMPDLPPELAHLTEQAVGAADEAQVNEQQGLAVGGMVRDPLALDEKSEEILASGPDGNDPFFDLA